MSAKVACSVCGGGIKAGTGHQSEPPQFSDHGERGAYEHWLKSLPPEVAEWRWTCDLCHDAQTQRRGASDAVAAILGRTVSEADAGDALSVLTSWDFKTGTFVGGVTARANGRATGKRFGHLTDEQRALIAQVLDEKEAARYPQTCTWGACALCGRRESRAWHESRLTWPDGSPAPICDTCEPVYEMRGEPVYAEDVRLVAGELARGWPLALGSSLPRFRYYAESPDCDGNGFAQPWEYDPRLIEWREEEWTRSPRHAPADRRAEFHQRHDDRMMRERANRLAEHRKEAARAW